MVKPNPNHCFWETVAFSLMLGTALLAMLLLIILGAEYHSRSVTTVECVAGQI